MTEQLVLALFVTQENRHRAMANLSLALQPISDDGYDIFEWDVREYPAIAEAMRVLATPTLVRFWPEPKLNIIGDLSDVRQVRRLLLGDSAEPALVHNLYARQDVRHEELADQLREEQIRKWQKSTATEHEFPFNVMEELSKWAKELADREAQLGHRERFVRKRESQTTDDQDDHDKRKRAGA